MSFKLIKIWSPPNPLITRTLPLQYNLFIKFYYENIIIQNLIEILRYLHYKHYTLDIIILTNKVKFYNKSSRTLLLKKVKSSLLNF